MKNKSKRVSRLLVLVMMIISFIVPLTIHTDTVHANFEGDASNCVTTVSGDKSDSGDDSSGGEGTGEASGDWTTKGTKANKMAQKIWDFWKKKGANGAAIAGIMGNVGVEGGFDIPDRAQGHFTNDSKTSGVSEGVVPEGGGGGHYQFTPYTKYAPLGDKKWLDTDAQSEFVWTSEAKSSTWYEGYRNGKTPEESSKLWFKYYERGQSYDPAKDGYAKTAYEKFGGADIPTGGAIDDAEGTADGGEEQATEKSNDPCSTKTSSGDTADGVVGVAKALLGYFSYQQVHGEHYIGSVDSPDKNGITDCSGFVWLALTKAGYKTPPDMGWFTKSMEDDAKGDHKYLKEISKDEATAGDVVIVNTGNGAGSNGHTAILLEKWKDQAETSNQTKMIEMGGDPSAEGVNERPFSYGFLSLVDGTYGPHTTTFARPIKK